MSLTERTTLKTKYKKWRKERKRKRDQKPHWRHCARCGNTEYISREQARVNNWREVDDWRNDWSRYMGQPLLSNICYECYLKCGMGALE